MICSKCQTQNDAGRKFCLECGARLASGCPNCGAENSAAAKFCGECGTSLGGGSAQAPAGERGSAEQVAVTGGAERRLVTVLFADLVGSTALAADQDPEDTRDFLTRYFDLTRTIIERYGGTIEKFIGDAVMAVWGAPTAHEDDAERAVRAALDIVSGVPVLDEKLDIAVRAGVLTGEAAVTIGASGQGMVAGDLVNTASRLQSVAPPGSVLVGEGTFRAASGAIGFEEAGPQLLKGKQAPIRAWRATSVVALRGGSGRSEALEPPFTGRDEELRLLKEMFHATEREHKARLALVVGQGGIGKSRLAWEFEKYVDGVVDTVYWHNGRSPAYGEGISYWALAEMVRGRAGIAESDEPQLALTRLREALSEWIPDDQERNWVEPRLAALLALEPMPQGSRDELFAAWRTFFERIAERAPTVLVFEDIQWADDGMLDFITELLDRARNAPVFVVTLARPELHERRPGWGASLRSVTAMNLDPLEPEHMAAMIRGTVPGIPGDAVSAIAERADGIPLYAVEMIRMLIDRGDLVLAGDGHYTMARRLERLAVPETLHALIAARLDGLGERDRKLLQTGAVLGQSFTLEALSAVAGDEADALRDRLAPVVRRQLLRVDVDPRSPERGQYQFVQAVVREVAEGSLARSDRRALHVAAARYYESLGDDELAGVLASHYVEAYRATPPGPEADALAAQARVSLRAAAERAIALHSYRQAVSYLEQALAVTTDPLEQAALHERAVDPAEQQGLFEVALDHSKAVETLARERGDDNGVLRGLTLQASAHMAQHHERPVIALLRPALAAATGREVSPEVVFAQAELARALMIASESEEAVDWCNNALAAADLVDERLLVEVLITKGTALGNLGRSVEGEVLLRGAAYLADQRGLTNAALRARNNLVGILEANSLDAVNAILSEGYALARRVGFQTWAFQFAHTLLGVSFERGYWDAGMAEAVELEPSGFYLAWQLLEQAQRAAFRGHLDIAREKFAAGVEIAGTSSSQASTGMAETAAALSLTEGDWGTVMQKAREAWIHIDAADHAAIWAMVAGAAANRPEWISEAHAALAAFNRQGRYIDGEHAALAAAVAAVEGRGQEARAHYLSARRDLVDSGAALWFAALNLCVGARAADSFPEARDAAAAADEFFDRVGARAFVDMFRAAIVPAPARDNGAPVKARTSGVAAS